MAIIPILSHWNWIIVNCDKTKATRKKQQQIEIAIIIADVNASNSKHVNADRKHEWHVFHLIWKLEKINKI